MTKTVVSPKIEENGMIVYPVDISLISKTRLSPDGLSMIADYSGDLDLPLYIPPTPKTRRIISTLEFYRRLPMRLMIALVNPDIVTDIQTHTMLKVFNKYIQCSQVAVLK